MTMTVQGSEANTESELGSQRERYLLIGISAINCIFFYFIFERFIKIAIHSIWSKAVWATLAAIQEDRELYD